jgi:hypothetical protein
MIIYKASAMESKRVSPPESKIIDKAAMMKSRPNCGIERASVPRNISAVS